MTMNNMPVSLAQYLPAQRPVKSRFKRMMITLQGEPNTGKTEFILSAPGPGVNFCIDPGYEACELNPNPPDTRNKLITNYPWRLLPNLGVPGSPEAAQAEYANSWGLFYNAYFAMLEHPDVITGALDGGTEQWEAVRLALWGKIDQIMQLNYTQAYGLIKAFSWRQCESGKNVIQTYKLKEKYVDKLDAFGAPVMDKTGKKERIASGVSERDGYLNTKYLWSVQLETIYEEGRTFVIPLGKNKGQVKKTPGRFGLKILECKYVKEMTGTILWGSDCNFAGLIKAIFPKDNLADWGY